MIIVYDKPSHRQGFYHKSYTDIEQKELMSLLKRTCHIACPSSHWEDVMQKFEKQRSHDFKHYLILISLYFIALLGANYRAELMIEEQHS